MFTYVIKLEDNCWYVGKTEDIKKRKIIHFRRKPQVCWLKLHKPISIVLITVGDIEKELTLKLMKYYGWENVRGYCWSSRVMKLPPVNLR